MADKKSKLSEAEAREEARDFVRREIMMEDKENFDSFRAKVLMAIQAIREEA